MIGQERPNTSLSTHYWLLLALEAEYPPKVWRQSTSAQHSSSPVSALRPRIALKF